MSNVGKATDGMLDTILELKHNRDATLDWISIYLEAGQIRKEQGEWLVMVLKGEDV